MFVNIPYKKVLRKIVIRARHMTCFFLQYSFRSLYKNKYADNTYISLLTLYVPRCSTTQGKFASLPTATVTFGMGWANRGSSIITAKKK